MKKPLLVLAFLLTVILSFAQPPLPVNEPVCFIAIDQEPLCSGSCDGIATVTAYFFDSPGSVDWSNSSSASGIPDGGTNQESFLCNGTYTVTVTDGKLLTGTCEIVLTAPAALNTSLVETNPTCIGCNGSIDLTVIGGTGSYSFQWFDNVGSIIGILEDVSSIPAGCYFVKATDQNNCTSLDSVCLLDPIGIDKGRIRNDVQIYRHKNQLHISGIQGTVTVFNFQGQRVHQSVLLSDKNIIPLEKGIYLVRVLSEGKQLVKKIYLSD
ncbi:MAG: T9SS type A sorting domain-containing protein [Bacteroidetes bacterium]|nr:T9SS type A sorting domain-containing protein [Bacteroidota bacterium]